MAKIDINMLGTSYNILDEDGKLVKVLKIIDHKEVLNSVFMEYDPNIHTCIDAYIEHSKENLVGFTKDISSIMYYTSHDKEIDLIDIIDKSVENDAYYVLLDIVDEEETL